MFFASVQRFVREWLSSCDLRILMYQGPKEASAREDVCVNSCVNPVLLMDFAPVSIERDQFTKIRLGQENPRTWINAAWGQQQVLSPLQIPNTDRPIK